MSLPRYFAPRVGLSVFLIAGLAGAAKSLDPHVHGEGQLEFVLDYESQSAELSFKFPAVQVIGFEHAPKTAVEKSAHADSQKKLKDPKNIFSLVTDPKQKAECVFGESVLRIPHSDGHDHAHHAGEAHAGHADYELVYRMNCKNLRGIKGFRIEAFKNLKDLKKLSVRGLVGDKALSQVMGPRAIELDLISASH